MLACDSSTVELFELCPLHKSGINRKPRNLRRFTSQEQARHPSFLEPRTSATSVAEPSQAIEGKDRALSTKGWQSQPRNQAVLGDAPPQLPQVFR